MRLQAVHKVIDLDHVPTSIVGSRNTNSALLDDAVLGDKCCFIPGSFHRGAASTPQLQDASPNSFTFDAF